MRLCVCVHTGAWTWSGRQSGSPTGTFPYSCFSFGTVEKERDEGRSEGREDEGGRGEEGSIRGGKEDRWMRQSDKRGTKKHN